MKQKIKQKKTGEHLQELNNNLIQVKKLVFGVLKEFKKSNNKTNAFNTFLLVFTFNSTLIAFAVLYKMRTIKTDWDYWIFSGILLFEFILFFYILYCLTFRK